MKEKAILINELKQFEKQLYKTNSLLSDLRNLENSLKTIEGQAEKLEVLTESHPELEKEFKNQLKGKEVINQFKKLESEVQTLKTVLNKHEEKGFRADLFLENFRKEGEYSFDSINDSVGFLETVFSLNRVKEVFFGPRISGIVSLNKVSQELGLEKVSPHYLKVPVEKLELLWNYLNARKGKATEFVFDSDKFRISFLDLKSLSIKSSNEMIKKIDFVSKEFEAKILK